MPPNPPDLAAYAIQTIEALCQAYGVVHQPTIVREQSAAFTHLCNGRPQVVFGHAGLLRVYQTGLEEYPGLPPGPPGLAGVHQLCLHEFTHALLYHRHARDPTKHGRSFRRLYGQLIHRHQFLPTT